MCYYGDGGVDGDVQVMVEVIIMLLRFMCDDNDDGDGGV